MTTQRARPLHTLSFVPWSKDGLTHGLRDLVIAELVFVLSSKRTYSVPPQQIANALLPLLALPHLKLRNKLLHHTAFALYTSKGIDYIDAYNPALTRQCKRTDIFTFDTDFDDLPGITRHETL